MKTFAAILFVLLTTLCFSASTGKNIVGNFLGYGTCPNCGDTWWHNNSGSIEFCELKAGVDYHYSGNMDAPVIKGGVMICEKCLNHPEQLDAAKIGKDLIGCGWNKNKVTAVIKAVEDFKANPAPMKKTQIVKLDTPPYPN